MTKAKHSRLADILIEVFPVMHRKICNKSTLPLPSNQFITLIVIFVNGPMNISDIAMRLGISKQQMSPIIHRMQADGYINRQPSSSDKRANLITLTDKAVSVIEANRREMSKVLEVKLHGLTNQEIDELTEKFTRCLELLKKIP